MIGVFRALHRRLFRRSGRRGFEGSMLGEAVAPYMNQADVFVAPTLGVKFVEPWPVIRDG